MTGTAYLHIDRERGANADLSLSKLRAAVSASDALTPGAEPASSSYKEGSGGKQSGGGVASTTATAGPTVEAAPFQKVKRRRCFLCFSCLGCLCCFVFSLQLVIDKPLQPCLTPCPTPPGLTSRTEPPTRHPYKTALQAEAQAGRSRGHDREGRELQGLLRRAAVAGAAAAERGRPGRHQGVRGEGGAQAAERSPRLPAREGREEGQG